MCSIAGQGDPVVWVFSTSGFHRFFATRPVCSETNKQSGDQVLTMVLSGTPGPQLFRMMRGGLASDVRRLELLLVVVSRVLETLGFEGESQLVS
jgi:hypothetical protein